ncbi:hypothetical protein GGI25_003840 [Coemansia spiralis]|uniref:Ribosomal protein/NADH dehydrogenase domain-containing protein n=2 Tax=Coemansia TaxID=4863 RepID=A0A9W8G5M1_9FUNG|nr:thioredoxin-like protein [Coemansia spiralis]KAJ1990987.1 hypothetical protein EDC05_003707 [Coemansia umbellata]KAJ2620997.1 hypothetical protein GGI26_004497 [Coemansia sp. RSA 1358]KAJ2675746.1 hypothetical protein GGI25_003840 [Coemansia spiralis]
MSARALTKSLKELRVHFSLNSPASRGLRDFIVKSYPELKQANPGLPILIREANVESRVIARFAQGRERKIILDNLSASEVEQKFNSLVSEAK